MTDYKATSTNAVETVRIVEEVWPRDYKIEIEYDTISNSTWKECLEAYEKAIRPIRERIWDRETDTEEDDA